MTDSLMDSSVYKSLENLIESEVEEYNKKLHPLGEGHFQMEKEQEDEYFSARSSPCMEDVDNAVADKKPTDMDDAEQACKKEILLEAFSINPYPTKTAVKILSSLTNMPNATVKIWFNNRRARYGPVNGVHADPGSSRLYKRMLPKHLLIELKHRPIVRGKPRGKQSQSSSGVKRKASEMES